MKCINCAYAYGNCIFAFRRSGCDMDGSDDFNEGTDTDDSVVPSPRLKDLARWCNRAWIRKSCTFEDYR